MDDRKPLSIGQVLDRGFGLYRRSLRRVLPFCLATALIAIIPNLMFPAGAHVKLGELTGPIAAKFALIFVFSLVNLMFLIAVIRKLDDVDSGSNRMGTMEAFTGGLRYFLPLLGASILYGLVVMLGFVLLIVPGIIFSVSMILAFYAVVLDGAGSGSSLERSRSLVRGHWWRTWTILTVTMLIYFAVYGGVVALTTLILPFGNVVATAAARAAPNIISLLLVSIVLGLLSGLLMPMLYAVGLVTYRDLQLRKGGDDLAARIAAAV